MGKWIFAHGIKAVVILVTDRLCFSIVGIGNNSPGGVPVLRGAVEEFCLSLGFQVVQGQNPGRLYISLQMSARKARQQQQQHLSPNETSHDGPSRERTQGGIRVSMPVPPDVPPPRVPPRPQHSHQHSWEGGRTDAPEESSMSWLTLGMAAVVGFTLIRKFVIGF